MARRSNPRGSKGKFSRCVKAVSKRGGAVDPRAVCGAMEKKYRGNPEDRGGYVIGNVNWVSDLKFAKRQALKDADASRRPVTVTDYRTGRVVFTARPVKLTRGNPEDVPNKRAFVGARRKDGKYPVQLVYPLSGRRISKLMTDDQVDKLRSEGYEVYGSKSNPAAGAVQAYEEFHGRKPDEFVTVKRQIHIHRHLAGAGQLRKLKVQSVDGKSIVTLSRFGNALLAFNEDKNQLFIEGGSQSVDLKAFGIRTQHEIETLGKVTMIDYFTRKDHLGEEGGTAVYRHKFRTVNQDGRPVIVRILRYPDLIYFVRDKHLVFSGGDYEILAEGIDK